MPTASGYNETILTGNNVTIIKKSDHYIVKPGNGGVAKLVVNGLLSSSLAAGVKKSVLQVDSKNSTAINLYESLGFNFHHEYVYRSYQKTLQLLAEGCC